jgi:HlyD family secretion protein
MLVASARESDARVDTKETIVAEHATTGRSPETKDGSNGASRPNIINDGSFIAPPSPTTRVRGATDAAHSATGDVEATLGLGGGASRGAKLLRRLLLWGIPALAIIGGGIYLKVRHTAAPIRYATTSARRGDLAVTVTATGTLAALDTVDVGTEVSGVVDVVAADYNDHVRKGQTLAVINTDQLRAQIRQGEAALQAAQATAQQTYATLAETRPQAMRAETLFTSSSIAMQELEGARASLARALAADANARAQIAASAAALQAQRTVLEKATIRSPISGVVLQRQIEPGRTVAASFQTPVLFVLAADLKRMTLALDIDEADVGQVRAGQEADFTVDAYPDRTFTAKARSVRNAAKTVEGVVTYQAILDVANPDLSLRPGMTATAVIKTTQVHDALLIPNAALRFTPATDTSGRGAFGARRIGIARRVWVIRQGTPVAITLTVGMTDGQWTEVTGGDVAPGTALITGVIEGSAAIAQDSSTTRRPAGPVPISSAR